MDYTVNALGEKALKLLYCPTYLIFSQSNPMHDCSEITPTEFKETSSQVIAHKDCVKKLAANRSKTISFFCLDPVDNMTMTMGATRIYVNKRHVAGEAEDEQILEFQTLTEK